MLEERCSEAIELFKTLKEMLKQVAATTPVLPEAVLERTQAKAYYALADFHSLLALALLPSDKPVGGELIANMRNAAAEVREALKPIDRLLGAD